MNQPRTYYTDDITLVPIYAIWRTLRRSSFVTAVPLICYFLLRKALRWRYRANYATARPEAIPKVAKELVPTDVVGKLTPVIETCLELGFSEFAWTHPEDIGHKESYSVGLLHETSLVVAIGVWFRITLGDQVQERVVFGCHSFDESGMQLSTGVVADHDWIPEMVPPNQQPLRLPVTSNDHDIIEAHFDRVASRSDLVEFDSESLEQQLLATAQALFDHAVERGFYVPITVAEFEQLSKVSDVVTAELA